MHEQTWLSFFGEISKLASVEAEADLLIKMAEESLVDVAARIYLGVHSPEDEVSFARLAKAHGYPASIYELPKPMLDAMEEKAINIQQGKVPPRIVAPPTPQVQKPAPVVAPPWRGAVEDKAYSAAHNLAADERNVHHAHWRAQQRMMEAASGGPVDTSSVARRLEETKPVFDEISANLNRLPNDRPGIMRTIEYHNRNFTPGSGARSLASYKWPLKEVPGGSQLPHDLDAIIRQGYSKRLGTPVREVVQSTTLHPWMTPKNVGKFLTLKPR